MALAVPAQAQSPLPAELGKTLGEGVRCQDENAPADLTVNISKVQSADRSLVADALAALAADEKACEPVRAAALALRGDYIAAAAPDANVTDSARAVVEAALADAERRTAALKFEVGPPPLNLSRGRKGGS